MQFQPEILAVLLAQSDEELWRTIKGIAVSGGVRLPRSTPSPEQMKKLRAALGDGTNVNLAEAMRIIERYKNGDGK